MYPNRIECYYLKGRNLREFLVRRYYLESERQPFPTMVVVHFRLKNSKKKIGFEKDYSILARITINPCTTRNSFNLPTRKSVCLNHENNESIKTSKNSFTLSIRIS